VVAATNGLGSAAFTATGAYDAAGVGATQAQRATNGLGSAAFTASTAYDLTGVGAAQALAATNGLGASAFKATSFFDLTGVGATAALNATNGWPWGTLYDAASAGTNAAKAATNGMVLASLVTITNISSGVTNNAFGAILSSNFTATGVFTGNVGATTNAAGVPVNQMLATNGNAGLLTGFTYTNTTAFILQGQTVTAAVDGEVFVNLMITNSQMVCLTNNTSHQIRWMGTRTGASTNTDNCSMWVHASASITLTNWAGAGGATLLTSEFDVLK
jgi:hypothetical protein